MTKVKVMIPISLRPVISKTAWDRDSVLTGYHLSPQPCIKAVKKFTWRTYALSERLLVWIYYVSYFTENLLMLRNCFASRWHLAVLSSWGNWVTCLFLLTNLTVILLYCLNFCTCFLCFAVKLFYLWSWQWTFYYSTVCNQHSFVYNSLC